MNLDPSKKKLQATQDSVKNATEINLENAKSGLGGDRWMPSAHDEVNSPEHYASGSIECIDAIEASMTPEAFAGYCKGNCQKYLWRYLDKGGVQSLEKCQWYLQRLIDTENNAL